MPINIAYCPDHGATKTVVAAGNLGSATHVHADATKHACTVVAEASETQPVSYPHIAADSTSIADADAWHAYLEKYVP